VSATAVVRAGISIGERGSLFQKGRLSRATSSLAVFDSLVMTSREGSGRTDSSVTALLISAYSSNSRAHSPHPPRCSAMVSLSSGLSPPCMYSINNSLHLSQFILSLHTPFAFCLSSKYPDSVNTCRSPLYAYLKRLFTVPRGDSVTAAISSNESPSISQ